jgi:hypothetical protein
MPGELGERQRVPRRGGVELADDMSRRVAATLAQYRVRAAHIQASKDEPLKRGPAHIARLPRRQQAGDWKALKTPGKEQHRLAGRRIEPRQVVNHDQQGRFGGDARQ